MSMIKTTMMLLHLHNADLKVHKSAYNLKESQSMD